MWNQPWMITDKSALRGTLYVEFLPGRYEDEHWNEGSVFFDEEGFGFIEPTIKRHWPSFNPYGPNMINQHAWCKIDGDLSALRDRILAGERYARLRGDIALSFDTTEAHFLEDEDESLARLARMFGRLGTWLRKTLTEWNTISVLGL